MPFVINLSGRRALVTGASMGIGASIARLLAQAGCDVAGCGLEAKDGEDARRFFDSVRAAGRRAYYEQVDLTDAGAPDGWVASAVRSLGGCDILVSNAGRNFFEGAADCTDEAWQKCMRLNLEAHWRLARAARPWLESGTDPVILVISSIHAFATYPQSFPYNVAKAGLVALVQSLAIEWGPRIRTVGIAPGFIGTERYYAGVEGSAEAAAGHMEREARHPVGRMGRPEDIGALCVFLASPWSGFASGETFVIDGGVLPLLHIR